MQVDYRQGLRHMSNGWACVWKWLPILGCVLAMVAGAGCGSSSTEPSPLANGAQGHSQALSAALIKHLLTTLPYRYDFKEIDVPKGDDAAVAGTVWLPGKGRAKFGSAFSSRGNTVQVGTSREASSLSFEYAAGSISITSEGLSGSSMVFNIEEKLCRWTTGKGCGI
jgi:hypothetical protein